MRVPAGGAKVASHSPQWTALAPESHREVMSTENTDQVGDRTRNLAWYDGVRPALRRSPAVTITRPPITELSTILRESTAELLKLRPAAPVKLRPVRPGVGRHRSPARVPWLSRALRVFAR
jgi:hypothetical protein